MLYNKRILTKGKIMNRYIRIKQRKQAIKDVIIFTVVMIPITAFSVCVGHMIANGGLI